VSIRVDGLTEAKETVAALPQAFKDVAVKTIDEGTDIMWSEAFSRAPVGHGKDVHPGKLKASIAKNVRDDGLQASVGSGVVYAKFVEFGTNDTPAEPFLYPAFRIGARYIRGAMKDWADDAGNSARFKTKRGRKK
jgi:HK97 gp10 family phage protein